MTAARKVLIIDDEPDTVLFLSTWLEDRGYLTCSASNGLEGMEVLRREQPDLVLMDLKMPGQTGVQLYRRLRQDPATRELPVIFITGVAEVEFFDARCVPLPPPNARLDKPVDLRALQAAIERVFG